jgi:hypothetical protein
MTMSRRFYLLAVSLIAVVALAGCGGGHKDAGQGRAASPPGAVLDRVDLAQSVQNLETLKSFRFDLSMKLDFSGLNGSGSGSDPLAAALLGALGDIKAEGSFVAPDQSEMTMAFLGQQFSFVIIGQKAWLKTGGAWQSFDLKDLDISAKPQDFFGDVLPPDVLKVAKTSREKVDGVDTTRYSFDKKALEQLVSDFARASSDIDEALASIQDATMDIWLNADNIPVKMTFNFGAKTKDGQSIGAKLEMNVRDINDPSIKIKPPS